MQLRKFSRPHRVKQHQTARAVPDVSTEGAVTVFGIIVGIGNAISQLVASSNLASVEGDAVAVRELVPPAIVAIAGLVIGAFLLPSGA